jgi:hypothetical protein
MYDRQVLPEGASHHRRRRRRIIAPGRWRGALLTLVVVVLVGSGACSPPKFRYVANSETETYLKVPRSWTSFEQSELTAASAAGESGQTPSAVDSFIDDLLQWRVAFDAAPSPSLDHVVALSVEPVVDVRVRRLLAPERDQVSLASLRNFFVPYDDLRKEADLEAAGKPVGAPTTSSQFRPIDEQELQFENGLRGTRLIFGLRGSDGAFYTFDQTVLLDGKTERVYALLIRASEKEYFSNSTLLDEIATSFTVKRKG